MACSLVVGAPWVRQLDPPATLTNTDGPVNSHSTLPTGSYG